MAWGDNSRIYLLVYVYGNIPLYAYLIWLLWFKTEVGLSHSKLVLCLTPVDTVLGHTELIRQIFST